MTAARGGYDLMPEQDTKPINKYLPPRPRTEASAPTEASTKLENASPEGGFLGWVDRLLSA